MPVAAQAAILTGMGSAFDAISDRHRAFIEAQHLFFVASAPSSDDGHVNLSPKGYDTLRVLGPNEVAYLDLTGSGAELDAYRSVKNATSIDGLPSIGR